jgi:hypothetical protein
MERDRVAAEKLAADALAGQVAIGVAAAAHDTAALLYARARCHQ